MKKARIWISIFFFAVISMFLSSQKDEGLKHMKEAVNIAPTDELKKHFNLILKSTTAQMSKEEMRVSDVAAGLFVPLE
jgi:hypothetical protein